MPFVPIRLNTPNPLASQPCYARGPVASANQVTLGPKSHAPGPLMLQVTAATKSYLRQPHGPAFRTWAGLDEHWNRANFREAYQHCRRLAL